MAATVIPTRRPLLLRRIACRARCWYLRLRISSARADIEGWRLDIEAAPLTYKACGLREVYVGWTRLQIDIAEQFIAGLQQQIAAAECA